MARLNRLVLAALFGLSLTSAQAATLPTADYHDWLQKLEDDAVEQGINPDIVSAALDNVVPEDRVVTLDQKQPEGTATFASYAARIVSDTRANDGHKMRVRYAPLLNEIGDRYSVPPEVIVALWGVESVYGRNSGNFPTINALVTLAYTGRRADFFRKELINALRILDQEHMPASSLRGSWAGAVGQCQFMPSTYLKYAVDYDEKGNRDVWTDQADVFASIANYISALGWDSDYTWGREVRVKNPIKPEYIGLEQQLTLKQWQKMGVRRKNGADLPDEPIKASLLQPDGPHGRSFLVYDNFKVLLRWNRSSYFALAVGLLSDRIK